MDYSRAKDRMLAATDTTISPWYVVNSDNKKKARLNCIAHLLSQNSVPGHDPGGDRAPAATIGFRVQATEIHEPAFCARALLRAIPPIRRERQERPVRSLVSASMKSA